MPLVLGGGRPPKLSPKGHPVPLLLLVGGSDMEAEPSDCGRMECECGFLYWSATRRKFKLQDPFFSAGDIERELLAKHVALDLSEDEGDQLGHRENADDQIIFCPIVGCGAQLRSLEDFEDHYRGRHSASCSVCSRVYPTSRLLSMHVSEAHDSFFQAKVARGYPMYECLVEGCGMKLKSYQSRKQHLIDKHKFPISFEFFKKVHPSKHQRQKHQKKEAGHGEDEKSTRMVAERKCVKQKYQPKQSGPERELETIDMEVDKVHDLSSALSRLSTSDSTPSSVNFGHRHNRGFAFIPRSVQRNKNHPLTGAPS